MVFRKMAIAGCSVFALYSPFSMASSDWYQHVTADDFVARVTAPYTWETGFPELEVFQAELDRALASEDPVVRRNAVITIGYADDLDPRWQVERISDSLRKEDGSSLVFTQAVVALVNIATRAPGLVADLARDDQLREAAAAALVLAPRSLADLEPVLAPDLEYVNKAIASNHEEYWSGHRDASLVRPEGDMAALMATYGNPSALSWGERLDCAPLNRLVRETEVDAEQRQAMLGALRNWVQQSGEDGSLCLYRVMPAFQPELTERLSEDFSALEEHSREKAVLTLLELDPAQVAQPAATALLNQGLLDESESVFTASQFILRHRDLWGQVMPATVDAMARQPERQVLAARVNLRAGRSASQAIEVLLSQDVEPMLSDCPEAVYEFDHERDMALCRRVYIPEENLAPDFTALIASSADACDAQEVLTRYWNKFIEGAAEFDRNEAVIHGGVLVDPGIQAFVSGQAHCVDRNATTDPVPEAEVQRMVEGVWEAVLETGEEEALLPLAVSSTANYLPTALLEQHEIPLQALENLPIFLARRSYEHFIDPGLRALYLMTGEEIAENPPYVEDSLPPWGFRDDTIEAFIEWVLRANQAEIVADPGGLMSLKPWRHLDKDRQPDWLIAAAAQLRVKVIETLDDPQADGDDITEALATYLELGNWLGSDEQLVKGLLSRPDPQTRLAARYALRSLGLDSNPSSRELFHFLYPGDHFMSATQVLGLVELDRSLTHAQRLTIVSDLALGQRVREQMRDYNWRYRMVAPPIPTEEVLEAMKERFLAGGDPHDVLREIEQGSDRRIEPGDLFLAVEQLTPDGTGLDPWRLDAFSDWVLEAVLSYSETAAGAAGPGSDSGLPPLDWPPPRFSRWVVLTQTSPDLSGYNLEQVKARLTDDLSSAGYMDYGLFGIPGGFALVTEVERIDEEGRPVTDETRFIPTIHRAGLGLDLLMQLLGGFRGQFRVFVFAITDEASVQGGTTDLNPEVARSGDKILPASLAQSPFGDRHVHLLVYHFEKVNGNYRLRTDTQAALTHLKNSMNLDWK
jgi:hypothetical protein